MRRRRLQGPSRVEQRLIYRNSQMARSRLREMMLEASRRPCLWVLENQHTHYHSSPLLSLLPLPPLLRGANRAVANANPDLAEGGEGKAGEAGEVGAVCVSMSCRHCPARPCSNLCFSLLGWVGWKPQRGDDPPIRDRASGHEASGGAPPLAPTLAVDRYTKL